MLKPFDALYFDSYYFTVHVWSRNSTQGAYITKTRLFKHIENFTKKGNFSDEEKSDIFHISAQNVDCGYSLEPPRWGGSNEYPQYMF